MVERLRIVAVNDVYSLECLPRLKSLVAHHATHDPAEAFIVVIAGDFLAPSVLSSLDAGRGMVDCLNHVPITHAILGNHEDDIEPDQLLARLHELQCIVLMTNVHGLDESFPKKHVLEVGGQKVGLIGVTDGDPTLYRRRPFGGARIDPPNESARRAADELLAEGCCCVIAITHQRARDDRALARTTPAFPVILGGHEHDGLLEQIGETWLTKAPAEAVSATVIDLELPSLKVHARFEPVANYPDDPDLRARVNKHMARVHELEGATILMLTPGEKLSSIGTRVRQTSMGTMICTRLREAFDADGCLFNGGGIRGAREYSGRLTFGDLENEVPFDNEIVVAHLSGRVLAEAVASSRANAPAESGGFLQVDEGMVVDAAHRVTRVAGAPLDPERIYRIALVRNLFEGMDQVEPLIRFAKEHPEQIPMITSGREVKVVLVSAFSRMLWQQLGGFEGIDENGDGVVTPEELVNAIARAGGQPPSQMAARVVLDALDANKDGTISREEPKK
jgi:2',3'-cyclic-nucleotide 2'-phosphodiesterase (5'-nucleotidase family)